MTGTEIDEDGKPRVEHLELWKRNPVDCIREIMGNPALRDALHYRPIKVFSDESCDEQIFNEMRTAEWWWDIQVCNLDSKTKNRPNATSS